MELTILCRATAIRHVAIRVSLVEVMVHFEK